MAPSKSSAVSLLPPFERELKRFQTRLSTENLQEFKFASLHGLQDAIQNIQKEQSQRQGFRNLNRIRPFINGLVQYSKTIEVFVNVEPLLGVIWGPIKFCLQIASKVTEAFDALLDAYERIGLALPIIQAVDPIFCSHPHVQQVLADVFEDILTFHKRAIVFFNHRTWKLTFKLTFHTFSDMFEDVLKNLERSRGLLFQSTNMSHFQEAQEARLLFAREFQTQLKRDEQEQRLAVVEWLSADQAKLASSNQHLEHQQRRAEFPSTTQWIFNMSAMKSWMRRSDVSSTNFWLCGIPGAGKTVLCSSVIDKVSEIYPDAQVIYFYCKSNDSMRRTFDAIARTLLVQLLDLNPNCLQYLYEKMVASSERHAKSTGLFQELLEEMSSNHDLLFVCIDGLDECEIQERRQIMSLIESITTASKLERGVRFFVTGRREKDIEKGMSSAIHLNIKSHHVENDITSYIKSQALKLRELFQFTPEREREYVTKISSRPQGMFLLARLIMDNLLDQENMQDLEDEMDSKVLPIGIEEAYGRIMQRLYKGRHENNRKRAKFVLEIVTNVTRALHIHEIQGALSINLDDQTIDLERRRSVSLGDLCGPIVEIHLNGVIDMIHPTAKDYLTQHHSGHFLDNSISQFAMAKLCIGYLTFDCFDPSISDSQVQRHARTGEYSFQQYATCNWIHHFRASLDYLVNMASQEEVNTVRNFYNILRKHHKKDGFLEWSIEDVVMRPEFRNQIKRDLKRLEELYRLETIPDEKSNLENVSYLLVQLGRARGAIEELSLHLITKSEELFVTAYGSSVFKCRSLSCPRFDDGFVSKALRDAHYRRHERPFKCERDECDYSTIGFSTKATLSKHVRLCHDSLANELVFPKLIRHSVEEALTNAIQTEDIFVVRTLAIELLDLPNPPTGFLWDAIARGCSKSALILVEILGDTDEINHQKSGGDTVLHLLAARPESEGEQLIPSILETSVNINIENSRDLAAIHIAIQNKSELMVRKLLKHPKMDHASCYKGTQIRASILLMAIEASNENIILSLLDTGREHILTNHQDITDTLKRAVNGSAYYLRRLLFWGRTLGIELKYPIPFRDWVLPDLDDIVLVFRNELSFRKAQEIFEKKWNLTRDAIISEDTEKVGEMTKEYINYVPTQGLTLLETAASYGDITILMSLFSKEKGIFVEGRSGNSPLELAAARGHNEIVQILVGHGADINQEIGVKRKSDGSALQQAIVNGHYSTVQILLSLGANPNIRGTAEINNVPPLILAATLHDEDVALMLLTQGADVNAKGPLGETALHMAAKKGHLRLAHAILERSVDHNAWHSKDGLPLMVAVSYGHEGITAMLLEKDIGKGYIDWQGSGWIDSSGINHRTSALHRAASNGHTKIVEMLLNAGARIDISSEFGKTPLALAKENEHDDTVKLLRSRGAELIYKAINDN